MDCMMHAWVGDGMGIADGMAQAPRTKAVHVRAAACRHAEGQPAMWDARRLSGFRHHAGGKLV